MDFAWYHDSRLCLLEIRDYRNLRSALAATDLVPRSKEAAPHRFTTLVDKVTDSLLMLLAMQANTLKGKQLAADLPTFAKTRKSLTLIIALGLPDNLRVHISSIRTSLNAKIKGRIALADIDSVAVLDYQSFTKWAPRLGLECELLS
ncbi:MAG: hypothetical protein VBE63_17440 [Lamprobacter sp.]|uniref:hypothetical protein n=1 Tax=Lamprobacter sp. TaxID=3100796 RepID=UPI002B25F30B|nr:hypothetical protein [Lamprobacter sp.]MEA3641702.1 hypothetical protein [Lamprobacter sp.]